MRLTSSTQVTFRVWSGTLLNVLKSGFEADDVGAPPSSAPVSDQISISAAQHERDLREIETLKVALLSNRRIGQAMGVIMATAKVTEDEAFDRLRQASQNQNRKLRHVADDVVATGELPPDARRA